MTLTVLPEREEIEMQLPLRMIYGKGVKGVRPFHIHPN